MPSNATLATKQEPLPDPTRASNIDIDDITHFLLELDALKRVNRRSYVTGTTRSLKSLHTLNHSRDTLA